MRSTNKNVGHETGRNRQKSITIILVLFGSIIGFVIIALIALTLIDRNEDQSNNTSGLSYIFYEPDYDYDIMNDEVYLALDRSIYFNNSETGLTVTIDKENMEDVPADQKEYVAFIIDFIQYAIEGKHEELNSLFSNEYIEADGKTKIDFTMQQLYNIKITYIQSQGETVDGETIYSYDYWLEYMIRKNNGTFRSDMGSDCTRKEYVRITNRDGDFGIDVLAPYTTKPADAEIISDKEIAVIAAMGTIIIVTFVAIFLLKKSKRSNKEPS